MKFKINKFIALSAIILLGAILSGCTKKDAAQTKEQQQPEEILGVLPGSSDDGQPDNILEYWDYLQQATEGTFSLVSHASLATQSDSKSLTGGFFYSGTNPIEGGTVQIGNISLSSDVSKGYMYGQVTPQGKALFGNTISLSLNPNAPGTSGKAIAAASIYIPAELTLSSPLADDVITTGTTIEWNTDRSNTRGVMILLEYDPENLENAGFAATYPNPVHKAISVADIGSYTLTYNDVSALPNGSRITLRVARGNYRAFNPSKSTSVYGFHAYTLVESVHTISY
ncbi:MAG TPA: hypothetical protein VFZ42_06755 [Chitinophagaceae bacterium]